MSDPEPLFRVLVFVAVLLAVGVGFGCSNLSVVNPSFEVTYPEAKQQLRTMREDPVELDRPLIFVGPFLDPGFAEWVSVGQAKRYFSDHKRVGGVSFVLWDSFDSCRAKTIRKVDKLFPPEDADSEQTVEVDVIAFSMGGLVARYAALPPDPKRGQTRRLNIRRLYTIASPHRGANWAPMGFWNSLARDMNADSDFLARLVAGLAVADFELVPYTRVGDWIVGPDKTSPKGQHPHWVSDCAFEMAHIQAAFDARIQADILTRLRGGEPLASLPATPLPER
ncbi:MAG: hypothetical protein AAGA25_05510 [Planctomycetota bacterium]